jgi:hypothetical protein
MAHVNNTMTEVRIAVARLLSIPAMPILARSAVAAANTAERIAQKNQLISESIARHD